ncbi:MAG: hypothetical protein HC876_21310, partial [Chloroflexaceae bacterium]|nr:hypothetical protein [Chloroflexaceae bacterium]
MSNTASTTHSWRKIVWREVLLYLWLVMLVWSASILGYNNPAPLVVDAEFHPDTVFVGFHEIEYEDGFAFRWTNGAGTICLPQVGYASRNALRVTLLGKGAHALNINEVRFLVDNTSIASASIRPALHEYDMLLNGFERTTDDFCVTLISETADAGPTDRRIVGVPFEQMVLYRHTSAGMVWPAVEQLSLNIAVTLLLFGLLRVLGLHWIGASIIVTALAVLIGIGTSTGVLGSGVELARNLYVSVGIGAVLLVTGIAARQTITHPDRQVPLVRRWLGSRLGRDLLAMALWSLILWSAVRVIQFVYGHSGVWPLKAGIWPDFTLAVLLPLGCFGVWLALLLRLLRSADDPTRPRPAGWFVLLVVLVGAIFLPVLLKTSVRGWELLYYTFTFNPTDYILDVPRVGNPITFLGSYVELSPT